MTTQIQRLSIVSILSILSAFLATGAAIAQPIVDYDIVYVRQPRYGDNVNTIWPEATHPARAEPGADLMLLHPDGTEETLVAGGNGSVTDPFVSFDGEWVYYSLFYDLRPQSLNGQRWHLPEMGADIFRIHLASRIIEQLTFGEFTPNTGAGAWDETNPLDPPSQFNRLGYGILNLGACPLPGGRIAFTSNRNGFVPVENLTAPTMQLFVMDEDGSNVTLIAPMNIGSALHPVPLRDGRIMFSTYETQGVRDFRLWGLWTIWPDGRQWAPMVSAFNFPQAVHFSTQLGNEDVVVIDYYNLNNNGFGAAYRFPVRPPAGVPGFFSAFAADNPDILQSKEFGLESFRLPFTPWGMYSITPFTHGDDTAAPPGPGAGRVGKVTHPSAAPGSDLLLVWTPGPANDLNRPTTFPYYDGGIYLNVGGDPVFDPGDYLLIKNDPAYNEAWPRAVVPYSAIHGVAEPVDLPWLPNDGNPDPELPHLAAELPPGTPYGLVGTSSFYKRESFPGDARRAAPATFDGLDPFNSSGNNQSSNWSEQGSDAGKYDNTDIWAVRVLAMEPNTHRSYGPNAGRQFENHANERLRILGEIPLRKYDGSGAEVLDLAGNPDTSFLVKIPADTPFTFQTLDRDGIVLNMAQTWHQVRPGEARYDCGGCHAHSEQPLDFDFTAAAAPTYEVVDLSASTPLLTKNASGQPDLTIDSNAVVDVEFYRDIRPILERSCISCHTGANPSPPGNLVLDDTALYGGLPGDYKRLADDSDADWGYPPVISTGTWRQTNASRYVRKFQSRRSLLIWKLFGRRLDGWTNSDHPTESVPGNVSTLPAGAVANEADLDYTGTIMPPAGTAPPLSEDEKILFARWIDLGAPINSGEETGDGAFGWFLDDLKPTLELSLPRPGLNPEDLAVIRVGLADANSGIDLASLSVKADFTVAGRPPESELADLGSPVGDGIWSIALDQLPPPLAEAHVFAEVADWQGNITRVDRRFVVDGNTAPATTIHSPTPSSTFNQSTLIAFAGSAQDLRDGDLTSSLAWESDIDGALGVGGTILSSLSAGTHNIVARVVDSGGMESVSTVFPVEITASGCSDHVVLNHSVTGVEPVHSATQSITLWTEFSIGAGGQAVLRAGDSVVFMDGVGVSAGGELTIEFGAPCS